MSVHPPATVAEGAVHDHPDAAYIKQDDLGLVIAKGLAVMYKSQPANPVDFLAKWLLNYSHVQQNAVAAQNEQKVQVKELKDKHEYQMSKHKKQEEAQAKAKEEKDDKIKHFYEKTMGESSDLTDQL